MNVRTCVCVLGALLLAGPFGDGKAGAAGRDRPRPRGQKAFATWSASAMGLLTSPFGQGPFLAAADLYRLGARDERRKDEVRRPADDKSGDKAVVELLHDLTRLVLKMDDRIGKLEAQLKEVQDREKKAAAKTKAEQEAMLKYMRGVAEGFVDCGIRRDGTGLATSMAVELKKSLGGDFDAWNVGQFPPNRYSEYTLDDGVLAPSGPEATFRGTLADKDKKHRGRFLLRVAKDKDSGRYFVVFFSARQE